MATVNKSAAAKSAAARAERAKKTRTIKWRGGTYTIPHTLPPTYAFDLGSIMAAAENGDAPFGKLYTLVESVCGESQMQQVRKAVAESNSDDGGMSEMWELLGKVSEAYGAEEGE